MIKELKLKLFFMINKQTVKILYKIYHENNSVIVLQFLFCFFVIAKATNKKLICKRKFWISFKLHKIANSICIKSIFGEHRAGTSGNWAYPMNLYSLDTKLNCFPWAMLFIFKLDMKILIVENFMSKDIWHFYLILFYEADHLFYFFKKNLAFKIFGKSSLFLFWCKLNAQNELIIFIENYKIPQNHIFIYINSFNTLTMHIVQKKIAMACELFWRR